MVEPETLDTPTPDILGPLVPARFATIGPLCDGGCDLEQVRETTEYRLMPVVRVWYICPACGNEQSVALPPQLTDGLTDQQVEAVVALVRRTIGEQ